MLMEEAGKGDVDFFSLYVKAILIASAQKVLQIQGVEEMPGWLLQHEEWHMRTLRRLGHSGASQDLSDG
jgi:hypothetical protein